MTIGTAIQEKQTGMDTVHDETASQVASATGVGSAPLNLVPFAPNRRWTRFTLLTTSQEIIKWINPHDG